MSAKTFLQLALVAYEKGLYSEAGSLFAACAESSDVGNLQAEIFHEVDDSTSESSTEASPHTFGLSGIAAEMSSGMSAVAFDAVDNQQFNLSDFDPISEVALPAIQPTSADGAEGEENLSDEQLQRQQIDALKVLLANGIEPQYDAQDGFLIIPASLASNVEVGTTSMSMTATDEEPSISISKQVPSPIQLLL